MKCDVEYEIDSQLATNTFVNDEYTAMSNMMIHTFLEKEDSEFDAKLLKSFGNDLKNWVER